MCGPAAPTRTRSTASSWKSWSKASSLRKPRFSGSSAPWGAATRWRSAARRFRWSSMTAVRRGRRWIPRDCWRGRRSGGLADGEAAEFEGADILALGHQQDAARQVVEGIEAGRHRDAAALADALDAARLSAGRQGHHLGTHRLAVLDHDGSPAGRQAEELRADR